MAAFFSVDLDRVMVAVAAGCVGDECGRRLALLPLSFFFSFAVALLEVVVE